MEPVVKSTVKMLGNGWNPGLQAKPFLVLVFKGKPRSRSRTLGEPPVQRSWGYGFSASGKVLDSREEMCNVVHGKGVMIWQ